MARKAELNRKWMDEGFGKLRSKFSNVVFFETEDPARYEQFLKALPGIDGYRDHAVYEYDPWGGLRRYDSRKRSFSLVRAGEGDRYAVRTAQAAGIETSLRDLAAALRHMDRVMKSEASLLLLRHMESAQQQGQDRDPTLVAALRAWANDAEIAFHRSAVIAFCAKTSLMVDEPTAKLAAVVPVDIGEDTERAFVLWMTGKELGREEEIARQLGRLVRMTAGLNLHQLRSMLVESFAATGGIDTAHLACLKSEWMRREEIVEILEPQGGFETVGGYEAVKNSIRRNILEVLSEPERAASDGVRLPRGFLFFGPPGTGKTLFAKALAGETRLPFINLKTENLFSRYLGESGRLFGRAIAIAENNSPCLVFVDEIDRFGRRTGSTHDGASEETRRVFNQILEWLGDKNRRSILVGTTNRPQDLDPAFTREGRLDYKVPFLYPDAAARREILRIHLGMTGASPPLKEKVSGFLEKQVELLVEKTEHFSGAELEELTQRVRRSKFRRRAEYVEEEDFSKALAEFRIPIEERREEIRAYMEYAKRFTNEAAFLDAGS